MILVLDATVFTSDTTFSSPRWGDLQNWQALWGLRIVAPFAVRAEAVANARRKFQDGIAAANKGIRMATALGLSPTKEVPDELSSRRDGYEALFDSKLGEYGIDVLPADYVDGHAEAVRRATERVKPCKPTTGDGYRDVLNWLSVVRLVRDNPDETVVWVSNNHSDFGDRVKPVPGLHEELLSDLDKAGGVDRTKYFLQLREALDFVVHEHRVPGVEDLWPALQESVAQRAIVELNAGGDTRLDLLGCGLPLLYQAVYGVLDSAKGIGPADVANLGAGGPEAELPFTIEFEAAWGLVQANPKFGLVIERPVGHPDRLAGVKILVAAGTVRVAADYEILRVSVEDIYAPAGDVGVADNESALTQWAAFNALQTRTDRHWTSYTASG